MEIIIRRDVNFHEDPLAYNPNMECMPYLVHVPSSFIPSPFDSTYILVFYLHDNSEDENSPSTT